MVIYNDLLVTIFTLSGKNYRAITLFPFIFARKNCKEDKELINHEKIHLRQQLECLVIFFYVIYIINFLGNLLIKKMNRDEAYRNITFEKEAYSNEKNFEYIRKRKLYGWMRK